ncbi:MAG TPA: hypothetical protein VFK04_12880 [Gemmatimonadaceae bacterium]|nr:hypothetical protein [Gemmatimonadaceae bacterium]
MANTCKHPPKKVASETETEYEHGVVVSHREWRRCDVCGAELPAEESATP